MMSTLTLLKETQDLGSALPRKTQVLASLCPEISQVLAPLPKSWHLSAKTWPLENLWIRPDGLWGLGAGIESHLCHLTSISDRYIIVQIAFQRKDRYGLGKKFFSVESVYTIQWSVK